MIDMRTDARTSGPEPLTLDERSMRVLELGLAGIALISAILLAAIR